MNTADILTNQTISQVESRGSIQPIIVYLERRSVPITDRFRDWLKSLFQEDRNKGGNRRLRLVLRKRVGRPPLSTDKIEEHERMYLRVNELVDRTITLALCKEIATGIGHRVEIPRKHAGRLFKFVKNADANTKYSGPCEFTKGKRLTQDAALHVTAAEFGRSYSGVRKIVRRLADAEDRLAAT